MTCGLAATESHLTNSGDSLNFEIQPNSRFGWGCARFLCHLGHLHKHEGRICRLASASAHPHPFPQSFAYIPVWMERRSSRLLHRLSHLLILLSFPGMGFDNYIALPGGLARATVKLWNLVGKELQNHSVCVAYFLWQSFLK